MESERKPRLTWETVRGVRMACWGGERVASVWPTKGGWYWLAEGAEDSTILFKTTKKLPAPTMAEAEAACDAYLRECLGLPARKERKKDE